MIAGAGKQCRDEPAGDGCFAFGKLVPSFLCLRPPATSICLNDHRDEFDALLFASPLCVKIFPLEILVRYSGGSAILGRSINHNVTKATCDSEVQGGWDALSPARQVNVGWSAAVRVPP